MSDMITIRLAVTPPAPDAWLWALGSETIRYRGRDLSITPDVLAELAESAAAWHPPIYDDHDPDGPVLGRIVGARVMMRDEAMAEGIDQQHDAALYLAAEWTPEGRRRDEAGEVYYSSVGIRPDYVDHTGRTWAWALAELSITDDPVLKRGQIPRPALAGITLSEEDTMDEQEGAVAPDMQTIMDEVASLRESVGELRAMVDEMKANAEMPEDAAEPAPSADAIAMSERVAKLEAELRAERAEKAVIALSQERQVGAAERKALVKLHQRDPEAYALAAALMPARLSEQPRVAQSGPAVDVDERARMREIAAERGITLSEARIIARQEMTR